MVSKRVEESVIQGIVREERYSLRDERKHPWSMKTKMPFRGVIDKVETTFRMALSLLAMLTSLMLVMDLGKKAELLTVQDVKEILEVILPKRRITKMGILKIIKDEHKSRYSARTSHHRRNM